MSPNKWYKFSKKSFENSLKILKVSQIFKDLVIYWNTLQALDYLWNLEKVSKISKNLEILNFFENMRKTSKSLKIWEIFEIPNSLVVTVRCLVYSEDRCWCLAVMQWDWQQRTGVLQGQVNMSHFQLKGFHRHWRLYVPLPSAVSWLLHPYHQRVTVNIRLYTSNHKIYECLVRPSVKYKDSSSN